MSVYNAQAPAQRPADHSGSGPARNRPTSKNTTSKGRFGLLSVVPLVLVVSAFFLYPLVRMTFDTLVVSGADGLELNLEPFTRILGNSYGLSIVLRTVRIAVLSTLITLLVAFPLALWMRQISARKRAIITMIILSPLLTSAVVRALGWITILGPSGFLNQALEAIGFQPWNIMYTETAVIIGLVQDFVGFMVLAMMGSILKIPDSIVWASFNLGATRWQMIRRVIFPQVLPGVIAGMSIVFSLSMGTYVTPALLGGTRNPTLGTETYTQAMLMLNFDRGAAMAIVLFIIVSVAVTGLALAAKTSRRSRSA